MFYENLERLSKEKKNMSVWQLVDAIGLAHANTHYWKKGRLPKVETLKKLAECLDIPMSELLKEEPNAEDSPKG